MDPEIEKLHTRISKAGEEIQASDRRQDRRLDEIERFRAESETKIRENIAATTANVESISASLSRLDQRNVDLADRQAVLQKMHRESILASQVVAKKLDIVHETAQASAAAAQATADEALGLAEPPARDLQERLSARRDWRKVTLNVVAGLTTALVGAAILALVGWLAARAAAALAWPI